MGLAMASPFFLFLHTGFLVCYVYGSPHVLAVSVQGGNETDRLSLLAFKSSITGDPFGALNSWNESIHFCQWFGVTCGRRHQRVTGLRLRHQKLTGFISSHVANLSFLQHLWLGNNSLSGELPPELGRLRRLKTFSMLENSITGEIPANKSSCSRLIILEFTGNRLVGKIPVELGSLTKLTDLWFGKNNLTGGVPSTFGNLSSLVNFYASFNSISGSITYSMGRLRNLEVFAVAYNQLIGTIPPPIFNISSIYAIDVGGNQIQGSLPSSLGNTLPNLSFFGVYFNLFTGFIPVSISNATKLSKIQLHGNKFIGKVPPLGKLNGLQKLNCRGNHLGTRQQDDLSFLDSVINATNLRVMDLGENQFGGVLPKSICNFSTHVIYLYVDSNEIGGNIPSCIGNLINLEEFTLANNHLKVKVINLQYRGAFQSFIAECKALSSIKHRNILKVLTACSSIDYEGNDFKALVYDFMDNGSLDKWLHPNENEAHEESRTLDLLQRLNITIDIASALDYLHHHCSEPIVHCDLKPGNILLDNEMSAHLGDFGLTKFLLEATCESSANQSSSIGIRGTVGYAAPEYGIGNMVSTFGDIYSYGILLLEMFTGKRPTDSMFCDGLNLHTFATVALPDQVANIVDPVLFQQGDMVEASLSLNSTSTQNSPSSHKIHECLVSILKVGIACSQELPTNRMNIKIVVSQLHAIRNSMLEVDDHRGRKARDAM